MKKLLTFISVTMILLISNASAEMRYGITGSLTQINADGTETEGGETNNGSANHTLIIPSIFAEVDMGTYSLGIDYIPLDADVSDKTKSTTKTETSVTGTAAKTTTSRTQNAQAELTDHITLYLNYNVDDNWFYKAGIASVTVNTTESLDTGSSYGNDEVYGGVFGVGYNSGNTRLELVYTDYEDIAVSSSTARAGVAQNNKITADIDTLALKYSYVF